jgi:APA family basic amino acid/polyamine antiporter
VEAHPIKRGGGAPDSPGAGNPSGSAGLFPRKLGLLDATAIIVGSMIGSGIFLAPALIAAIVVESGLGTGNFVFIWIVGGLLTLCGALSYGELAAAFPRTGGQYVFLNEAFGPVWGFLYGWTLFMVIQSGFIAAVAVAFANYLGVFFSAIRQSNVIPGAGGFQVSTVQITAILLIVILTIINSRGLREGAFLQNVFTFAKVSALAGLAGFGLFSGRGDWSHFTPLAPETVNTALLAAFAVAMSKALFAYDSWNIVTFVAEETANPERTLPRALALGTGAVMLLYTLASLVYLYVIPIAEAAGVPDQRIAARTAEVLFGPAGLGLISFAILLSTAGCVNGLVLSGPRLYYAMARDGLFFRGAGQLHPERRIPVRSLRQQAIWSIALVLFGSLGERGARLYSDLLTFTSFASLLFAGLTVAGLFVLRRTRPELPRPYRVAGYPFVPALYLIAAAFFLIFIAVGDPRNSGFGLAVILLGLPLYWYWRRAPRP